MGKGVHKKGITCSSERTIMIEIIVAFYFSIMVTGQEWPVVVGPYESWGDCASVREFLDRRGYETDSCSMLPFPQEKSQYLNVGGIPKTDAERED